MKPTCEMVEYASIRLMLVWAMPRHCQVASEAPASSTSICCQSAVQHAQPVPEQPHRQAKAAILGALPSSRVTGVGAPW